MGDRGFDDEEERQKVRNRGRSDPELSQAADAPRQRPGCVLLGGGSERSVGFISSAGSVCVTIAATISIKGSVTWPKSSSLSGSWTVWCYLEYTIGRVVPGS